MFAKDLLSFQIKHLVVVQSLSYVWLFGTPLAAACQASLSLSIKYEAVLFVTNFFRISIINCREEEFFIFCL